jgi:hypothetical protein
MDLWKENRWFAIHTKARREAQALAKGQWRKSHVQTLIPARKRFDLVIGTMTRHTSAELLKMGSAR